MTDAMANAVLTEMATEGEREAAEIEAGHPRSSEE